MESGGAKSVSHWHHVLHNSLMLKGICFHTSHNTYNAKSRSGFPTNPIGIEIEGAGEGRKGAGSCPKLSSLGRVKYQQHVKHTLGGIGIPLLCC